MSATPATMIKRNKGRYDKIMKYYKKHGVLTPKMIAKIAGVSITLAYDLPKIFRSYGWDFPDVVSEKYLNARNFNEKIWEYYHGNGDRILKLDIMRICGVRQHWGDIRKSHQMHGFDFPTVWDDKHNIYSRISDQLMDYARGREISYPEVGTVLGCSLYSGKQKHNRAATLGYPVPDIKHGKHHELDLEDPDDADIKSAIDIYPAGLQIVGSGAWRIDEDDNPVYLLR